MIPDFQELSEKITRLAELANALRRENAALRMDLATLTTENADLSSRMLEAHQRVAALLDRIPVPQQDEEAA